MLDGELLMLVTVGLPFVGSFLLPLFGKRSEALRNIAALIMVGGAFVTALCLLPTVWGGTTVTSKFAGVAVFHADLLAVFMALVSLGVGTLIVLYSFGYITHYEHRNEYYFMVVLFLASMMGLVFSRSLIGIFLFWEITAVACWRLIGFFRDKAYVLKADKAFLVTVFGALMMLIGFIMVYDQTGSFDLGVIRAATASHPVANLAVIFILFGILSKSATLPLHTWLPDAGVAPSTVTALLHAAVLVKIGVYVFARLFVASMTIDPVWHEIVPWIAGISALVSASAALIDTNIKRIIAYSTISQLGFIFLGLSVGNEIGLAGGLLFILMHGIAKGGLFLCAGVVEQRTHEKDIRKLGGLMKTMPITGLSFLLCAFSIMGVPPFGGFFSKYMVLTSAVGAGQIWVSLTFMFGACLTIIYLFRVFSMTFLGEFRGAHEAPAEGSPVMVYSVATLAVLALASGIFIYYPSVFVKDAVQQMLGMVVR